MSKKPSETAKEFSEALYKAISTFGGNITGLNPNTIEEARAAGRDPNIVMTIDREKKGIQSRMRNVAIALFVITIIMGFAFLVLGVNNLLSVPYLLYIHWAWSLWIPLAYVPLVITIVYAFYPPSKIGEGVRIYNIVVFAIGGIAGVFGLAAALRIWTMGRQCMAAGWVASAASPPMGVWGDHTGMCFSQFQFWVNVIFTFFPLLVHVVALPILMTFMVLDQDRYLHYRVTRKLGSIEKKWVAYSAMNTEPSQLKAQYPPQNISSHYGTQTQDYLYVNREDPYLQHRGHNRLAKLIKHMRYYGYPVDPSYMFNSGTYRHNH